SVDSALPSHQECAVSVFSQGLYTIGITGQRIEFGWTRSPSPQPCFPSRPETASSVLIQSDYRASKSTIISMAMDTAFLNCTQPSNRSLYPHRADPYHAIAILKKPENIVSGKLRVLHKLALFPACEPVRGANPKCPVARGEQGKNVTGWETLVPCRLPWNIPYSVEAQQAELCAQPEIAVGRLSNADNSAFSKALTDSPRCV